MNRQSLEGRRSALLLMCLIVQAFFPILGMNAGEPIEGKPVGGEPIDEDPPHHSPINSPHEPPSNFPHGPIKPLPVGPPKIIPKPDPLNPHGGTGISIHDQPVGPPVLPISGHPVVVHGGSPISLIPGPAQLTPAQKKVQEQVQQIAGTVAGVRAKVAVTKGALESKIFAMNVRIADFMSDGFASETRITEFRKLLDDLEAQQGQVIDELAQVKASIEGLQKEIALQKLSGAYAATLLDHYTQANESLMQEISNFYQQLAYNLTLAEQNLLNADFLYAVQTGIDLKKDSWWRPGKVKLPQVVELEGLVWYAHNSAEEATTGEKAENILECFELARTLGVLEGDFQTLKEVYQAGGPEVAKSAGFKDKLSSVEEGMADLQQDASEMQSCPFIAQTHTHLVSEVNQFMSKIEEK